MSSEESKELKPLNTAALTEDNSEDAIVYFNEFLKTSDKPSNNPNSWFPTPDDPGDLIPTHQSKADNCEKLKNWKRSRN